MSAPVAKTASTIWGNTLLKNRSVVLDKLKGSISFEFFVELLNALLSHGVPWRGQQRNKLCPA